ncbi:sulfite exporter TauE/SafE family protein [Streptomyces sp. NPDC051940]|uniref:sulfite exporter TauE/SafE family protein n=1 Tax=Streptomyces sp. NPDC051940 TaxID=3155675 RepID=UPI0034296332
MTALLLAAALLIGVSLGLMGGGGSVLAVPALMYLGGLDAQEAIATSLFVVAVTSAVAVVRHARAGCVRGRTGVLFGVSAMAGAYAGGRLAGFVSETVLLVAFAVMTLAAAVAMIRGRGEGAPGAGADVRRLVLYGAGVGLASGFVGAGGGFLFVPALVLLGGLPMAQAVGTSLLVITFSSTAALAGQLSAVRLDWGLAILVAGVAVAGSLLGSRYAGRLAPDTARRAFGLLVLGVGGLVLLLQLPAAVLHGLFAGPPLWAALGAAVMGVACRLTCRRVG